MKFAYADPPYVGCAHRYPEQTEVDHPALIERLVRDYPGGRRRTREQFTVRDWVSANITLRTGLVGAKPPAFCAWLLEVLNVQAEDQIDDLFPGTGSMGRALEMKRRQEVLAL